MSSSLDRRQFIKQCGAAAVATGITATLAPSVAGIEPIVRNGSPKFKFSLAAYSYRDLLAGDPAALTLSDLSTNVPAWGLRAQNSRRTTSRLPPRTNTFGSSSNSVFVLA